MQPTTTPQKNTEYLTARMAELGLTEKDYTFTRVWTQPSSRKDDDGNIITEDHEQKRDYLLFDADEEGNIIIRYFDLKGQPYRWRKEDTKQTRDFIRRRLRDPKGSQKYHQEAGSPVTPYFPPGLIRKYQKCFNGQAAETDYIDILYLIEGEFKSFIGERAGIDMIGLPGIYGFFNGDIKGRLNEDIEEVIIKCKVKKIVMLFDADLLQVKWESNKDLAKRPMNFYGSIKSFRESLQILLDDDKVDLNLVYYMHINIKYLNDAKGLDDLLVKYKDRTMEIIEDLFALNSARKYFQGHFIVDQNKDISKVWRDLGLTDEQEFYKTYGDFIGDREFKFRRRRYIYNRDSKEVVFVRHEDAEKYMRIGPDWVKVIQKPNKFGKMEEEVVTWKISEIQRDYKKFPDFLEQIRKYDDFCNEPNWNGQYQHEINGCYNLCRPLNWKSEEGPITNTIKFLKHIFQGEGSITLDDKGWHETENFVTGDPFTVAMDWLTILIRHPKQMLPVPILVSPENNTGKSTFLKWLQILFESNMVILGNEQFKMKFNGHYITKFIIAIDEGFLEVDKKSEKERLKQLVTADAVYLENKGQNVRKINYYGKLIICSNDADRVMKIDDGESRWFVVRVPVLKEKDPDLETKLREEMPALLHFIYNRPIHHPRVDRLWFKAEWFLTD